VDEETDREAPSPDVKLVTIHVFGGLTAHTSAELAKNWLESEGIPCVLAGTNAARLYHAFDVPLMVREEDANEAARILKEYLESDAPLREDEPI
jgi:Putative prokaryotic signal transducing protein